MAPLQRLPSHKGGALGLSSSRHHRLFGWESVVKFYDSTPMEVRKEILTLEAKEFGDHMYDSDSKYSSSGLKWFHDLGKLRKRRLHFLHSITMHCQMETLLSMLIRDKKN